ncbi:MAG: alpha-L-fucosidase [Rikenellaceae bacterium]
MSRINKLILVVIVSLFSLNGVSQEQRVYQSNWESLKKYEVPEWWKNSKFGIYFHWGPYSVPAHDTEWYSLWMYREGHKIRQYHEQTYGNLDKFGYKDFIPMFTAKKFDADKWAKLFKKAGAQFAGPVAEHADGFAMWDSDLTEWDASEMGPKMDIVKLMQDAVKKQGMKYIITYHRHWLYAWYPTWDTTTDAGDPNYSGLYGPYAPEGSFKMGERENPSVMATDEFNKEWLARLNELMTKYDPDIIWFDNKMNIIEERYRMEFLANFYNLGLERGKEVVCTYKFFDLAEGSAVLDLERSRMSEKMPFVWLTDDSIDWNAWCHIDDPNYKSVNRLVDFLVDVVSKNGAVLLNVTPTAEGEIPKEVESRLLELGKWLEVNGEAIYNTRPWNVYGEGKLEIKEGHLSENQNQDATCEDIRFTVNGDQLYSIVLDWPESGEVLIRTLSSDCEYLKEPIKSVSMLGSKKRVKFEQTNKGLRVVLPKTKGCSHAYTLKIN